MKNKKRTDALLPRDRRALKLKDALKKVLSKKTAADDLHTLAIKKSTHALVALHVARHPNTKKKTILALSEHSSDYVRAEAVLNDKMPKQMVKAIAKNDPHPYVREAGMRALVGAKDPGDYL